MFQTGARADLKAGAQGGYFEKMIAARHVESKVKKGKDLEADNTRQGAESFGFYGSYWLGELVERKATKGS